MNKNCFGSLAGHASCRPLLNVGILRSRFILGQLRPKCIAETVSRVQSLPGTM